METQAVVVIILTYNENKYTKALVNQLLQESLVSEIIIVDNSDSDDYRRINRESFNDKKGLSFIQTENNGGYAAGNNIGIKYALENFEEEYFWIINNDIIIQNNSVKGMLDVFKKKDNKIICGSVLYYYNDEDKINENSLVQCFGGGYYYKSIAKSKLALKGVLRKNINSIDVKINFLIGASMMVHRSTFEDVGFLPEEYFLYNEELDWQIQAQKKGYELVIAENSEVIHLDSLSTKGKKEWYYYYLNRASILLTLKHYRKNIITVILYRMFEIIFRTPKFLNKKFALKGIKDGFFYR